MDNARRLKNEALSLRASLGKHTGNMGPLARHLARRPALLRADRRARPGAPSVGLSRHRRRHAGRRRPAPTTWPPPTPCSSPPAGWPSPPGPPAGGGAVFRSAWLILLVAGGVAIAPLAKPLLPEDDYVRYAAALKQTPKREENNELGRLPQHFADMHGWSELAATVAEVYRSLPPADQARVCIFGQNYGEAGAIDMFLWLAARPAAGDLTPQQLLPLGSPRLAPGK